MEKKCNNVEESKNGLKSEYKFYPESEVENPYERPPFFLEFHTWDGKNWSYKICLRNYIIPKEYYCLGTCGIEGHPYTIHEGMVNKNENVIDFETETYLKYVIDALNEKATRDKN